jgi:hypothetical protein
METRLSALSIRRKTKEETNNMLAILQREPHHIGVLFILSQFKASCRYVTYWITPFYSLNSAKTTRNYGEHFNAKYFMYKRASLDNYCSLSDTTFSSIIC